MWREGRRGGGEDEWMSCLVEVMYVQVVDTLQYGNTHGVE